MTVDKAGLLEAIAQAGTRGAEAYTQARQQLAAQQQEAVRGALSGVAQSATPEARAQLEGIVSGGYQGRQAQLTSDAATSKDYFSKLGAASGTFMDQAAALGPALLQQYEQELALKMAGSGGGGGGDWFDPLKPDFDTKGNFYNYLEQQGTDRVPMSVAARELAAEYGVPEGVIQSRFPMSDYLTKGFTELESARQQNLPLRKFRRRAVRGAQATPGPNRVERRYLVDLYRGGPPPGSR